MAMIERSGADLALAQLIAWLDGIDLPMFVLRLIPDDDRLEFVHANAALGRVAGIPTSIFPGHSAFEIFPTRMAEQLDANYRQCLRSDLPFSYEECLVIDGRETWWETTLSKPAGFDGKVVLGVAISTTDRKNREFTQAQSLANLTARFDELRLFSTMAAHDARGPLATVASLIDLVVEDFEDMGDGKKDLLAMASNTVQEALTQISATLERARKLHSDEEVRQIIDLGRLCGDIATMVDPEKNLEIALPCTTIECDEVLVQMGVRNLMSNAARFCENRISVKVTEDATKGMVWIDVADDGPGLKDATTLSDLTRMGETRDGMHGFGLRAVSQLVSSRGGGFEVIDAPRSPADLPGACLRMVLPGRILPHGALAATDGRAQLTTADA